MLVTILCFVIAFRLTTQIASLNRSLRDEQTSLLSELDAADARRVELEKQLLLVRRELRECRAELVLFNLSLLQLHFFSFSSPSLLFPFPISPLPLLSHPC